MLPSMRGWLSMLFHISREYLGVAWLGSRTNLRSMPSVYRPGPLTGLGTCAHFELMPNEPSLYVWSGALSGRKAPILVRRPPIVAGRLRVSYDERIPVYGRRLLTNWRRYETGHVALRHRVHACQEGYKGCIEWRLGVADANIRYHGAGSHQPCGKLETTLADVAVCSGVDYKGVHASGKVQSRRKG
jgi:hypothetical protein